MLRRRAIEGLRASNGSESGESSSARPSWRIAPRRVRVCFFFSIAAGLYIYRALHSPLHPPQLSRWATASERLGAVSPHEDSVSDACAAITPLFSSTETSWPQSCIDFLRGHWEQSPLLSRPGSAWSSRLLRLADVARMAHSWPLRFGADHGTAALYAPNSGFAADVRLFGKGERVPSNVVDTAMALNRTFVMHNLEVYWPPIGNLVRQVIRYFHTYTQVNLYLSPPRLAVVTSPHQDAHSVFIVQVHGAKRWCVHAPPNPLTLKPFQRGKHGDVIDPIRDRDVMGPLLLNVTLRPGQVLYIPRSFFHYSATLPEVLSAPDSPGSARLAFGQEEAADGWAQDSAAASGEGEPSMALTVSVLCEDVWATWLFLLGEALQELQSPSEETNKQALQLMRVLRRIAARAAHKDVAVPLLEALPRALLGECVSDHKLLGFKEPPASSRRRRRRVSGVQQRQRVISRAVFSAEGPDAAGWRGYALHLLIKALLAESPWSTPYKWLADSEAGAPLFVALDGVLSRKRLSCAQKLEQLEAMRAALLSKGVSPDGPLPEVVLDHGDGRADDIDALAIFNLEKHLREHVPGDPTWAVPSEWR
ncbi:hypothetical protein AB1Y20_011882 [Prymnesium parvum]|uniref:Bifunctional lysine-specific demethylase and histidyl-hydroxylase n=1 Tax=Prymnesium parvum TaxID=97485 RepID=A0AB34IKH8_PRYPA